MFERLKTLPIWVRIVGAFVLVMILVNGGMIFWGLRQQRRVALEQADAFAEASTHMAFTSLGLATKGGQSIVCRCTPGPWVVCKLKALLGLAGGDDGTRTRGLMRDRHAF